LIEFPEKMEKKRLTKEQAGDIMSRISGTTDLDEAARHTDLVFEAIVEQMDLKKEVFGQLDELCKPETILSSNTSGLSITEIAGATNRPGNFIGIHFVRGSCIGTGY
jgi:3-hydroxybutyryl-CoA dehydrogenase